MAWGRNRGMGHPREKSVLGGTYLQNAKHKIEILCQRSIKVMAPFEHDMKTVLPWCFSEDTRCTLTHAHDLVKLNQYYGGLATCCTYDIAEGSQISLDFKSVNMLAPKIEMFQ